MYTNQMLLYVIARLYITCRLQFTKFSSLPCCYCWL